MEARIQVPFFKQTEFISLLGKYINQGCLSRNDGMLSIINPALPFYKNAKLILNKFNESRSETSGSSQKILIPLYKGHNPTASKIASYLNSNLKNEVYLSLVHGSIATNEEIGYSDFDALVILRDNVFKSSKKLSSVAMHLSKCYSMMIEFDPLQHHGWFVMTESDLKQYPYNYFPIEILPYCGILTGELEITITIANKSINHFTLKRVIASLQRQLTKGYIPQNYYNAKGILSEFMLLPALFIQAKTGKGIFKKFSFELTSKFFTTEEFKVMNEVSNIRTLWRYNAKINISKSPVLVTPQFKKQQKNNSGKISSELQIQFINGLGDRMLEFVNLLQKKFMRIKFDDHPVFLEVAQYQNAIDKMVDSLSDNNEILSIYQVGGVSSPGISDIDLYVVFKNGAKHLKNPIKDLNYPDNYFFTHRLFGTCAKYATQLEKYTFFRNYKLLSGTDIGMNNYDLMPEETTILQHQIAIEYMIKAWITISISLTFGIVKVRDLLLHSKAILFDIEFLNIKDQEFIGVINEIMSIRTNWFETNIPDSKLETLVNRYRDGLYKSVIYAINSSGFYKSPNTNSLISKKVKLIINTMIQIDRSGFLFPKLFVNLSEKLLKIQKNINTFDVLLPIKVNAIPEILVKRQQTINEAISYNNSNLPGFLCTAYAMNIFEISKN